MTVNCIADSIIGSWLMTTVIVVIFATVETHDTSDITYECCPGNSIWIHSTMNCSDGNRVRLHCPNNGSFYSLNPEVNHFDDFTVVENNGASRAYLKFIHDYDSIPATKFCVSGKHEKDRWALVCFNDENENASGWKFTVFGTLSIISAIFLFLTLAVYSILPELRDIQDKAMASTIAFLAFGYILLATEQLRVHPPIEDVLCIPLGKFFEH